MSAACEVHNYAATIIGSQKDEITDLKKQLAEAITRAEKAEAALIAADHEISACRLDERKQAEALSSAGAMEFDTQAAGIATLAARLEKAEAADGNAGLRKLRDLYAREVHGNGDYYAGCQAQRESFVGDIDRILKAEPQPERDDGPLIAFSVDDCGHRYDDALADAVSELCRREIARGQR